jgi:hypothetical protein
MSAWSTSDCRVCTIAEQCIVLMKRLKELVSLKAGCCMACNWPSPKAPLSRDAVRACCIVLHRNLSLMMLRDTNNVVRTYIVTRA